MISSTRETEKNKMNSKLIAYYTDRLKKVISTYGGDDRKKLYIEAAKNDLKEVVNGRAW